MPPHFASGRARQPAESCACRQKPNGKKPPVGQMGAFTPGGMPRRTPGAAILIEMWAIPPRLASIRRRAIRLTAAPIWLAILGIGAATGIRETIMPIRLGKIQQALHQGNIVCYGVGHGKVMGTLCEHRIVTGATLRSGTLTLVFAAPSHPDSGFLVAEAMGL